MASLKSTVDPDGLLEYSVVYTDRSLNHMSTAFQKVMLDISTTLKSVYNADSIAIVPGGGTYGMEAVARQLATNKKCLIIRNGWFSYRWSQIFSAGSIPSSEIVLKAQTIANQSPVQFAPPPIEEVVETITRQQPDVVFAPHVETSAGMLLPDEYLRKVAQAVHSVGGLFVLDCIASGTVWVDMQKTGVDVLITAPQKGWTGTPCAAMILLSKLAEEAIDKSNSTSFACNLRTWLNIMRAYENGGHAYHATMPTDSLRVFRDVMLEAKEIGFAALKKQQQLLGKQMRDLCAQHFTSVAAPGFEAPSVLVHHTIDPNIKNGKKFSNLGIQIAAGVPLQCDEPADFQSFRIGLFGIDKLINVERTVSQFETVLKRIQ